MSTATTPQWALTISHAHGVDAFLFDTKDEGLDHLHGYVTEWWDDEITDPIPDDRDEAIERYFWIVDAEDYTLAEVVPAAKTLRTTGEAAEEARNRMRTAQRDARDTALKDWTAQFATDLREEFPNLPKVATIGIGFRDDVEGWYTTVDTVTFADGSGHGGLADDIADDLTELVKATNSFWTWADVVHDDPDAEHKYGINGHVEPVTINDPGPDGPDAGPAPVPAWTRDLAQEYRDTYPNQTVTAVRVAPTTEGPRIVEARTADGGRTTGGVCDVGNDAIFEHPSFLEWATAVAAGPAGAWITMPPHGKDGTGRPAAPAAADDADATPTGDSARPTGKARAKAIKALKAAFPDLGHQAAVNVVDHGDLAGISRHIHEDVRVVIAGHLGPIVPADAVAAMIRLLTPEARAHASGAVLTVTTRDGQAIADVNDWTSCTINGDPRCTGLPKMGDSPLKSARAILAALEQD